MKQAYHLALYLAVFNISAAHANATTQYWNNFLHFFCTHKEKVTNNKPTIIGTVGLIGAYGLWRVAKHKRAEGLYASAKITHAKLSNHYIQECALLDQSNSLDDIITAVAAERLQPLQNYLDELTQAINTTHQLHERLHCVKDYAAKYHSDIQKVLNNLAQLHNNLYRIRKQLYGMIGLQLHDAMCDEYSDEISLLNETFNELAKTPLRLFDFENETMRSGLKTIIMQKCNTPDVNHPYITYFEHLQTDMNQLHEALNDIAKNYPAYTKISQLLAQLRIIEKFVATDKNYMQEKQNAQEQLCLQKVETEMHNLQNSFDGIQADFEQLKEGHAELESRVEALEENREANSTTIQNDAHTA